MPTQKMRLRAEKWSFRKRKLMSISQGRLDKATYKREMDHVQIEAPAALKDRASYLLTLTTDPENGARMRYHSVRIDQDGLKRLVKLFHAMSLEAQQMPDPTVEHSISQET